MQQYTTHKYLLKCKYLICSQEFGSNRKDAKTCSPKCRTALSRYKDDAKRAKRKLRFETSPFAYFLAHQAIRAETLEVIPKSFNELQELFEIIKYSSRADGYGNSKEYAICHIHPAKSLHSVGTLHPSNLCVSNALINSRHSNALPASGFGHSILKATLNPAWKVSPETPAKKVIQQMVGYLGTALCEQLVTKLGLQPTQKFQYLEKLKAYEDHPLIKDAGDLESLTAQQLGKLLSAVTGKSAGFSFDCWSINPGEVFLYEAGRLSKYYPELADIREAYLLEHPSLIESFLRYEQASAAFRQGSKAEKKIQFFFDTLHGINLQTQQPCSKQETVTFPTEEFIPRIDTYYSPQELEELAALEAAFETIAHPEPLETNHFIIDHDDDFDEPNFQLYQDPKEITKPNYAWRF